MRMDSGSSAVESDVAEPIENDKRYPGLSPCANSGRSFDSEILRTLASEADYGMVGKATDQVVASPSCFVHRRLRRSPRSRCSSVRFGCADRKLWGAGSFGATIIAPPGFA